MTIKQATRWRHKARGTVYELVGAAELQTAEPLSEGRILIVYRSEDDGTLWVRPTTEFTDGRFEPIIEA